VRIVIQHNGVQYDVSADVVRAQVQRPENSAATLFFTLHNKGLRYTPPGSMPFFFRMDQVVVYMKKTSWLQVFAGYLDMVPYKQLYAGEVNFKATCTIKRLMHTWWDPALAESQSLLNQLAAPMSIDSGMGTVLRNLLINVGGWNIANIHIQLFPTSFLQFIMGQIASLQTTNAPNVLQFNQMLFGSDTTPGPGAYAGASADAGIPGPSVPGAGMAGTAFYLTQIVAACDSHGMGPQPLDNNVSAGLVQAGITGEASNDHATQKAFQQVQNLAQGWQNTNRNTDGAILGVAAAMVETGGGTTIRNLFNPSVPGSEAFPNDGPGIANGTACGIFGQTDQGWGNIPQRMNPLQAANMFFSALNNISGWRNMDPGQAIQQATQSNNAMAAAFDAAIELATTLVQGYRTSGAANISTVMPAGSVTGSSIPGQVLGGAGAPSGSPGALVGGATSMPSPASALSMVNPLSATKPVPDSEGAINFMRTCMGLPYVWGGTGPAGYDCLAEGSLIVTARGEVPIEEVTDTDYVLTRKGFRRVIKAWKVRDNAEVIEINVNGRVLWGTPEHRAWTENRGWVSLQDVTRYDTLVLCHLVTSRFGVSPSSSKATPIPAIPTPHDLLIGSTSSGPARLSIGPFMNTTLDPFPMGTRCTTSTMTRSTTIPTIWSVSSSQITVERVRRIEDCTHTSVRSADKNFKHFALPSVSADSVVISTNRNTTTTAVKQRRSVYDLWVDETHEFFANGVLVHNCSGLMQAGFKAIGVAIPRTTQQIAGAVRQIPNTAVSRGDLVEPSGGHVVMWMGDGTIIEAQQTGVPIHQIPANFNIATAFGVYRVCANGGPDPTAAFNPPSVMGPGVPPGALAQQGGIGFTGSHGASDPLARNALSYIFMPGGAFSSDTAGLFTGTKAFIEGQPLIQMIKTVCAASLRSWSSAPNGDFMAWYPDYWGFDGKPAVMLLADIEMKDCHINLSDDPLTTHVYVNGDLSMTGSVQDPVLGWLMTAGVATVEQPWLYTRLLVAAPGDIEVASGQEIMQRFGIRPLQQQFAMAGTQEMEFLLACQIFMEQWAKQYQTTISMTFMPELFPGMRVQLPSQDLQVYVSAVSHVCDYEQGFYTQVTIAAPSSPQAAPNMGTVKNPVLTPQHVATTTSLINPAVAGSGV
jgi:cell wall-associated NlpC family hydrolase